MAASMPPATIAACGQNGLSDPKTSVPGLGQHRVEHKLHAANTQLTSSVVYDIRVRHEVAGIPLSHAAPSLKSEVTPAESRRWRKSFARAPAYFIDRIAAEGARTNDLVAWRYLVDALLPPGSSSR